MACHLYNVAYCKVMTTAVYDMQLEDTEVQCIIWRKLNKVMQKNGVEEPNFKSFMEDSEQANWYAIQIVYGMGDPKVPIENQERTCLLYWTILLQQYTQKHIKPNLQHQNIRVCKQYKDSKTMEEADSRYLAIWAW
jgi:hypothetical protein